jgi:hypothetical protein
LSSAPRREIELELLGTLARPVEQLVLAVLLLRVDDLDAGAAEGAEQIVELLRRCDVGGQQLVDLVVFFFDRQRITSTNATIQSW